MNLGRRSFDDVVEGRRPVSGALEHLAVDSAQDSGVRMDLDEEGRQVDPRRVLSVGVQDGFELWAVAGLAGGVTNAISRCSARPWRGPWQFSPPRERPRA